MSLSYNDGCGNSEVVVYEGVLPDGLTHTVRRQDGTRLQVHDAHLCLILQADLSNIPKTPLDYCKEAGKGISKEEAETLARPRILTPIQQDLMDWHHRLYHLSFPKIFRLAEKGHLPSRLLDCKGKLPLCIACQFGTAYFSWRWSFDGSNHVGAAWSNPTDVRFSYEPTYLGVRYVLRSR
jgi:hypothetical protein